MAAEKSRDQVSIEVILWALVTVVLFDGLFDANLINGDDAIYADMARSAWNNGDFLSVGWHGTVLHEKPPILFFIVGLFGGVLGFTDTVVLLPNVIAAFLSLLLLRAIVRDLGYTPLVQGLAVLLLLSSTTFVFHSRRVMADPLFMLFMLGFMWAWFRLQIFPNSERVTRLRWAAGAFLGMAVLTKWIFAVLPVLAVCGWHMGRFLQPRMKDVFVVSGVAFLVAVPWHVMQSVLHGVDFWKTYAGYHVFERAGQSLVGESDPSLYLRTIYLENTILLLGLVLAVFFLFRSRGVALRRVAAPLVMVALVFAPIQFSSTRIEHYLLPVLPLMVLVGVDAWSRLIDINRMIFIVPLLASIITIAFSVKPMVSTSNFSPGSKAACRAATFDDPGLLVVNHYDVASTWHCRRPIKIFTDDPGFHEQMQRIDMLYRTKAVELMSSEALDGWLKKHPKQPILTRPGYGSTLLERLKGERLRSLEQYIDGDLLLPADGQI